MIKGLINRIIPFSSVDGPGNRMAIFMQGCNFNCLYCHNPETIKICSNCLVCVYNCPYNVLNVEEGKVSWNKEGCRGCDLCLKACTNDSSPKAQLMNAYDILKELEKVRAFISGVTISGGECMLQLEFLTTLFREIKNMGLTVFIDTNGSVPFWENSELTELMDMAMVDVKSFNPVEHLRLTGMDNTCVLKNIDYLADKKKLYEVRTVIVPGVLDNYYNVRGISSLIASLDPNIRYKLIKYRPLGVRPSKIKSNVPSDQIMKELSDEAYSNGCKNVLIT